MRSVLLFSGGEESYLTVHTSLKNVSRVSGWVDGWVGERVGERMGGRVY